MAFKTITSLDADNTISLGGFNKKTRKDNPTSVEGYYLGYRKVDSKKAKNGWCYIHFLQTATGNLGVWGKTDLDRKLLQVTPGTMIRASFDKMVPTPNGEMYKFKVELDDENTIEVSFSDQQQESGDAGDSDDNYETVTEESEEYTNDEHVQQTALIAAEKKARVEALLNRNKNSKTK